MCDRFRTLSSYVTASSCIVFKNCLRLIIEHTCLVLLVQNSKFATSIPNFTCDNCNDHLWQPDMTVSFVKYGGVWWNFEMWQPHMTVIFVEPHVLCLGSRVRPKVWHWVWLRFEGFFFSNMTGYDLLGLMATIDSLFALCWWARRQKMAPSSP